MNVKLLNVSPVRSDDSTYLTSSYGSVTNSSYEQAESKECCKEKPETTTLTYPNHEKHPCSCVEKGMQCHCSTVQSSIQDKPKKSIKFESWAKYKSITLGVLLALFFVWIVIFASLKSKIKL
ncbi:uncharacterized protein LOC111619164 [Centruroides sculpturatus]|nr:uncharacterized protein LOC111619164 [Centruroides sculpturatus]